MKEQLQSKSVLVLSGLNEQADEIMKTKYSSKKKSNRETFEEMYHLQHI